jgi:uncharacterized protein (TIGR03083 family)
LLIMDRERTLEAFRAESHSLASTAVGWTDPQWALPTQCPPWTVRDLLGHVRLGVARIPGMLAGPTPAQAQVAPRQYYRPDERFSAATNEDRVSAAQAQAAVWPEGRALAADYAITWQEVRRSCAAEPADRVVLTRHGDAMLLSDFMVTRVVEVAIHGLDLAAALNRTPWLTTEAAAVIEELITGLVGTSLALGWEQATFIQKATGRQPLTGPDRQQLADAKVQWLSLG